MDYGIVARDVALVVVEFLKVLAWPGVLLSALLIFREPINKILSNLEQAEMAGVSFKVRASELLKKVDQLPEKLKRKDQGSPPTPSSPPESEPEEKDKEANTVLESAKEQIRSSWAALENMTLKLHQQLFMGSGGTAHPYTRPRSVVHAVTDLHRNGMIDRSTLETFFSAQRLKDELLENASAATFGSYRQFLDIITQLKGRVELWRQGML